MKIDTNAIIGNVVNEVQVTDQMIVIHFADGSCIESKVTLRGYENYYLDTEFYPAE